MECVHQALELLQIREGDVLYDLGCGDGRLLIEVSERMKGEGRRRMLVCLSVSPLFFSHLKDH